VRTARWLIGGATVLSLLTTIAAAPAGAAGSDISNTRVGKDKIAKTAASFEAQGSPVAKGELVATTTSDGAILVTRKGTKVEETADGFRTLTAEDGSSGTQVQPLVASSGTQVQALAASWSLIGSKCFAALWRGAAHMDTCYRLYKMASDGNATKDYWRLDLYGTMFAEGRTLDWGRIHADRDAGPALSFVDWSPDSDLTQGCQVYNLSVTVAGFGAGFGKTFCEFINISKSAGGTVGWFQVEWNWGNQAILRDRDRSVAMIIGTSSTQGAGSPTFGVSWNFAAH